MSVVSLLKTAIRKADSLEDSGCRLVNDGLNRSLLSAMSTPDLDAHIADLDQEAREKRRALRIVDESLARALDERVSRRG
jgi:hypothetical protein